MLLWWDLLTRQHCYSSIVVGEIAAKVKSLYDLESSVLEDQMLKLQNDTEINARSIYQRAYSALRTTGGREVPQFQKMCNLFVRLCFLAHENQVQVQINND